MNKFLLVIFFFGGINTFAQKTGSKITIDSVGNYGGFEVFDEAFANKRIFFTGENHLFIKANNAYTLSFMKYLHASHGVKIMVLELGRTWGHVFNEYIQTGDSALFEVIKKSSHKEYHQYFEEFYRFNKSLSKNEKIKIVGVDMTRTYYISVHYLNHLLPRKASPPEEILVNVEAIRSFAKFLENEDKKTMKYTNSYIKTSDYSYYSTFDTIIANYDQHKELYKNYVGENFEEFEITIDKLKSEFSLWKRMENSRMIQKYIYRENLMLNNFRKLFEDNPGAKVFGQFGRCHVSQNNHDEDCDWNGIRAIATRLNQELDTTISGKIATIGIIYKNSHKSDTLHTGNVPNLIANSPKGEIWVYPYKGKTYDEVREEETPMKYDFVIIDGESKIETTKTPYTSTYTSYYGQYLEFINLGFKISFNLVNYNRLNQSLMDNGFAGNFTQPFLIGNTIFGEYLDVYKKRIEGLGATYTFYNPLVIKDANRTMELGGYDIMGRYIRGIAFRKAQNMHLKFNMQLGYSRRFLTSYDNNSINTGFPSPSGNTVRNHVGFFNLSPSVDFDYHIANALLIGLEGGYLLQVGRSNWKNKGMRIDGPNQKFQGFYFGGRVGLGIGY